MAQESLDLLESEVDAARMRVASDMVRLRSPAPLTALRDQAMTRAREAASETGARLWSDLKERAAANPTAVLAIGAGIAWHLARHPPITTLLVGYGLISLMRTSPSNGPAPIVERAGELVESVSETAAQWGEGLRETAAEWKEGVREAADGAREVAEEAAGGVREAAQQAAQGVRQAAQYATRGVREAAEDAFAQASSGASQLTGTTAELADRSSHAIERAASDDEMRDRYLVGAAMLAVGAATVISLRRGE